MFHGSMVALTTPMESNGDIDYVALKKLIDFHLENETDGFVIAGTTGESATLSDSEHKKLIAKAVEYVDGKKPVIAGTGTYSTAVSLEKTKMAMELGADACLIVAPYYNKPTQEGVYLHYKTIAEAVPIPIILYNHPGRTGTDISPDTITRLTTIPNIVGLKDANTDMSRIAEIHQRTSGSLDLYSGDDPTGLELIRLGGKGIISITANVVPKKMHDMCTAALNKQEQQAQAINEQLAQLHQHLIIESNPIPVKWALYAMGLINTGIRLPLTPLTQESKAVLQKTMLDLGVI